MTSAKLHLWTVDDYHRMVETGILTTDDRVELVEGQIVQMSPQTPLHVATKKRTYNYFNNLLAARATVRSESPVTLPPGSEPEPHIAVVAIDPREYSDHHPVPEAIFLLIELADTTLDSDLKTKATLYAKANIRDYWVLDVRRRQVHVFRFPQDGVYQQKSVLNEDRTLSLLAFPDVSISFNQLFPLQ